MKLNEAYRKAIIKKFLAFKKAFDTVSEIHDFGNAFGECEDAARALEFLEKCMDILSNRIVRDPDTMMALAKELGQKEGEE